jgi:hypothetical protein
MKGVLAFISVVVVMVVSAETVVLYDDGSQYTLKENEKLYVTPYSKLYYTKQYSRGDILFHLTLPNTKRDEVYVETGAEGAVGSHKWCETYIPWSEGLTFNMVTWQRHCDINGDGVYNMCDWYKPTGIPTFDELEWQQMCNDGKPYTND